jgi:hypothetical protein
MKMHKASKIDHNKCSYFYIIKENYVKKLRAKEIWLA